MSFGGFPEEALDFYEGLEADNSKAYWTDHKETYDGCVAAPMQALLAELEPEFGAAKTFRPYRDVRFSKDKSPYKTRQYAVIVTAETGLYVGLDAHGLHLGGGRYHASTEEVAKLRASIAADSTGSELVGILAGLRRLGFDVGGEQLKRVPKPWDATHPREDLLRHKTIIGWIDYEPQPWLHSAKAKSKVVNAWRALAPLNQWLADATNS